MRLFMGMIRHQGELFALVLTIVGGIFDDHKHDWPKEVREIRAMIDTTVLDYGDYDVLPPSSVYSTGGYMRYIFAVPQANTVGTNGLRNAITLLNFEDGKKLEKKIVKRNFMEMVTGPFEFRFLPAWSDHEIAYAQSRGFLLIDIHKRKVEMHTVSRGLYGGEIENVAVLNGPERTFVHEVLRSSGNDQGDIWDIKTLRVVNFHKDTFSVLAEKPAGIKSLVYTEPWFVHKGTIFIYDDTLTRLDAYDDMFNLVDHPIAKAFNQNTVGFRCMKEIAVHPTLPFALILEKGKYPAKEDLAAADTLPKDEQRKMRDILFNEESRLTLYLFRWTHPDPKKRFIPLLSSAGSIWNSFNPVDYYREFQFSPDGKWVVFRDAANSRENPVFVAVPIEENNPLYLGKPVKLGNALNKRAIWVSGTAWTTDPIAFVICDGNVLYRWVLDDYGKKTKVKVPPDTPEPFRIYDK